MMYVDEVQGMVVVLQSLIVKPTCKTDFAQCPIGTGRLEQVVISHEKRKRLTSQCKRQVGLRVIRARKLGTEQLKGLGALCPNQRIVVQEHGGYGLKAVGFEISYSRPMAQDIGLKEVVELLKGNVVFVVARYQSARAKHVVVVNPLCRISVHVQA